MPSSASSTPFADALVASSPFLFEGGRVDSERVFTRAEVDNAIRFCLGKACPSHLDVLADEWTSAHAHLLQATNQLEPNALGKRSREEAGEGEVNGNGNAKKQKTSAGNRAASEEDGQPLYTLHAISVTSPIRKKVHLSISPTTILLANTTTNEIEARIPVSSLKRAFRVFNLGRNKNKPHWTVVLLSADTWEKKDESSQTQLCFSVDEEIAAKNAFTTTQHPDAPVTHPKGTATREFLDAFLSHLPEDLPVITAPSGDETSSPFSSATKQIYVDAYRNAKEGSLYPLDVGILWAEAKPCEFFAMGDIAPDDGTPLSCGVRTASATGRTFNLYVRRRGTPADGEDEDGVEEMEGEETEFGMIDGREQENILEWVRKYKKRFGKRLKPAGGINGGSPTKSSVKGMHLNGSGKGKEKAEVQEEELAESDESDEDFVAESDTDGGEPSSDDESGSGEDGERGEGQEDDEEDAESGESEEEENEELTAERHPLLRPGAMPRMSKAAIDAAVGMVMGDLDMEKSEGGDDDELDDD